MHVTSGSTCTFIATRHLLAFLFLFIPCISSGFVSLQVSSASRGRSWPVAPVSTSFRSSVSFSPSFPIQAANSSPAESSGYPYPLDALAALLPRGVDSGMLVRLAPRLLDRPAVESFKLLDAHTRDGQTERLRHDALLEIVRDWLARNHNGTEILVDVPLALLPMAKEARKKSRRVDLVLVTDNQSSTWACEGDCTQRGIEIRFIEITSVRDDYLDERIAEKCSKYEDLPRTIEASAWAKAMRRPNQPTQAVVVHPVDVVAIGVLGTVPERTAAALRRIVHQPAGGEASFRCAGLESPDCPDTDTKAAALAEELRIEVLRHNLGPFMNDDEEKGLARASGSRTSRGAYLKRRQQQQRQRQEKKKRRKRSSSR